MIVNYANSAGTAADLVDEIKAAGGHAISVRADVSDLEAIDDMMGEVRAAADALYRRDSAIRTVIATRTS